jgi:hypothetical protein
MDRCDIIKEIASGVNAAVCVEIGTHTGEFSEQILNTFPSSILYCIDPYCSYNEYDDTLNTLTGDTIYIKTMERLKRLFEDRIHVIREFSSKAISQIPDQIDFLYIDGNHSYQFVKQDLELYYPKLKSTGYILGDDAVDINELKRNENGDVRIDWPTGCFGHYGVIKAFQEFIAANKLEGSIIGTQYLIGSKH